MKSAIRRLRFVTGLIFLINIGLFGQSDISEPFEKWQNERQPPDLVLNAIGVKPGMTIGEVGAGRGRYTVFLAQKTGEKGKVFANDIDEAALAYLRGRCKRLKINNIETIVGEQDDPLIPANSLDMAIMVLVYHMIESPDNLLINLKKSLKPDSKLVILDPLDKEIDREFGIDRSKAGVTTPTIKERIQKSALNAGYEIIKIDTILPRDYIFILKPASPVQKKPAAMVIQKTLEKDGIDASVNLFNKIKKEPDQYDLSEKMFAILGNEYIGARSYPEALAVLSMGIELYPESSQLYGTIGEVYLILGDRENARKNYKLFLENGPDSLNANTLMKDFDVMYEQMRQMNQQN